MEWIIDCFETIWKGLSSLITVASAVATVTPSRTGNPWRVKLAHLVNVLALNIGQARPGEGSKPQASPSQVLSQEGVSEKGRGGGTDASSPRS